MAVIFMTDKRIQYFDSMSGSGEHCLNVLLRYAVYDLNWQCCWSHSRHRFVSLDRYLHDEMEHKKKQKFDSEGWKLVSSTVDTPQQANGSDCGVFSCMFADFLSQGLVRVMCVCQQLHLETD